MSRLNCYCIRAFFILSSAGLSSFIADYVMAGSGLKSYMSHNYMSTCQGRRFLQILLNVPNCTFSLSPSRCCYFISQHGGGPRIHSSINGLDSLDPKMFFVRDVGVTRGHSFKFLKKRVSLDVGRNLGTECVTSGTC